jgi:hypothetical protein
MGSDIGYGDHATDGDGHGHAHGDGADEEGDTVGDPDKHETHSSAADRHQAEQFGVLRKLHRSTRAGAAPIHRGDPGYSSKLDRDGDGIACEN